MRTPPATCSCCPCSTWVECDTTSVILRPLISLFLRRLEGHIRGLAENPSNIVSRVGLGLGITAISGVLKSSKLDTSFFPWYRFRC